jgi:hypothetical protein
MVKSIGIRYKFVVIENKHGEIIEYGGIAEKQKGHYLIAILDSSVERKHPCYVRYPKKRIRNSKQFDDIDSCIRYVQGKVIPFSVGTNEIPYLSDNSMIKEFISFEELPEIKH